MKISLFRNICLLTLLLVLSLADRVSAGDWAASFGGSDGSTVYTQATATDASGNTYLAGYFDGATMTLGSVTLSRIGSADAFVAKLDPSGTVLWAKNFGGSGAYAYGQGIAVDGSGNVYLRGQFSGDNLTTPVLTKIGYQDAFALKLDSTGATTWAKNFGGSGASTYGNGIAVDGSGNVYLGGYFDSANLSAPAMTKIGSTDAFALKIDSTGATTWARNFGGSGANTWGYGIAVDGSGNVYLGGGFSYANLTTPALTKIGNVDAFALKLGSSGTTIWAKNFGGSGASAFGQGIAVDGSGNVYLGGILLMPTFQPQP
jgi:outer membrane protein assembly factor BamB